MSSNTGMLLHKLSKYQTLLGGAVGAKAQVYQNKVNEYTRQLENLGYGQYGGMVDNIVENLNKKTQDVIANISDNLVSRTGYDALKTTCNNSINTLNTQLNGILNAISNRQNEIDELKKEIEKNSTELSELQRLQEEEKTSLERKQAELERRIAANNQLTKVQQEEIGNLVNELYNGKELTDKQIDQIKELDAELAAKMKEINEKQKELRNTKKMLEKNKQKTKRLEETIKQIVETRRSIESEFELYKEAVEKAFEKIDERIKSITEQDQKPGISNVAADTTDSQKIINMLMEKLGLIKPDESKAPGKSETPESEA